MNHEVILNDGENHEMVDHEIKYNPILVFGYNLTHQAECLPNMRSIIH